MEQNKIYIETVQVSDIPWHRLTTPYGRATDFPSLFENLQNGDLTTINQAGETLAQNIEHQSTLWHCTPFAMIFLARIFADASDNPNIEKCRFLTKELLELFAIIIESVNMGDEMDHADPLPLFEDMLKEEYLWSEKYDEEEDEERWEDNPFPDDLFYSFYHYSREVLRLYRNNYIEKSTHCDDGEIREMAENLYNLLNN